jgi:threonine dehydrogenase-like Zn-dependent dehydrogenase
VPAGVLVGQLGPSERRPGGIEMLRDGGTYVEMGQFTDAGAIETSWHRIWTKDLNLLGSWGFTGNDFAARRRHALSHPRQISVA